jgi:hypothetical protein
LFRLANKVKSIIVYDGWAKAAAACGAKMLRAGVDDDVMTVTDQNIPPETEPVTEGGEGVSRQEPDDLDASDVVEGYDTDTQEKPSPESRMSRRKPVRRKPARYHKVLKRGGVADEAETVTKDQPAQTFDELNHKVTNDGEMVQDKQPGGPSNSSLTDGEVDFKTSARLERKFSKLYKARAEKAVQVEVEKFARKFARCLKIASARMKLNHHPHEFKASVVNVLTDGDSVQFSDGDFYRGMDQRAAVELTELIASEGHDRFVEDLLSGAADLLEKDARYLSDMEADLQTLTPVAPEVEVVPSLTARSRKAAAMRRKMASGNFDKEESRRSAAQAPKSIGNTDLGTAISGSTQLGRRLNGLGSGS